MVTVIRQQTDAGKKLEIALKNLEGKVGKVGWFEKSKYDDGTPVAAVAAVQEYGWPARSIPPRPFMRPTIISKQGEWRVIAENGAKAVLEGQATVYDVMEDIGQRAAGDIKKAISLVFTPPLSPRTIQARLNRKSNKKTVGNLTKPLIDTGIMFNSLINVVEDE